jgi:hypothetical protein
MSAADEADVDAIKRGATTAAKPRRRKRKLTAALANSSPVTSEIDTPTPAAPVSWENADDDVAAKGDRTFQSPGPASKMSRGEEEEEENLEAGAVGGALWVVGGLGVLINGIVGAESEC